MKQAEKWLQIRRDLFKHIRARVAQRVGPEPAELKRYRKSLEKDLQGPWRASSVQELFHQVESSDVIFLSDFHALRQSQKTHLRILRKVLGTRPLVIAVECVEARFQKHINAYLQGSIEAAELQEKLRWQENWGFPWVNYAPLFEWARQHQIPVYGINRRPHQKEGMKSRDRFAAQKIKEIREQNPDAQVFVIYGDWHLATNHIPKWVKSRGGRQLRILQNSEKIYFQILKTTPQEETEVVRLNANTFCVLNVPPWVKWQSYLMYLEETYDQDLDENIDFTDHIKAFLELICRELDLEVSLSDLGVYTAKDSGFWEKILQTCKGEEAKWVNLLIEEDGSFCLPGSQVAYLARPSVNQAASLAMEYILFQSSKASENCLNGRQDFVKWIWVKGWAYFGGKLVNPKRKTETLLDIKSRLTTRGGTLEKEPLQLALLQKVKELGPLFRRNSSRSTFKPRHRRSYVIAAELLGGLMGEKIYQAYRHGHLKSAEIRQLLKTDLQGAGFTKTYFNLMRFLDKIPLAFGSKEEKI